MRPAFLPELHEMSSLNPTPISLQQQKPKKKRNLPGNPDPDAEVIAFSPKTLMETHRFVCEICKKGFQRDQNLQLHRRGHNLPWKLRQRSSNEVVKKRVYVCPEASCVHHNPSRALGDLTGIKKHFCRKHGEKKWKCHKCSKRYAVQSDWKAHSKTCGTREYICDCGTLFSSHALQYTTYARAQRESLPQKSVPLVKTEHLSKSNSYRTLIEHMVAKPNFAEVFKRKDSFVTHRAFCDALAEENATISSMLLPTTTTLTRKRDSDSGASLLYLQHNSQTPPSQLLSSFFHTPLISTSPPHHPMQINKPHRAHIPSSPSSSPILLLPKGVSPGNVSCRLAPLTTTLFSPEYLTIDRADCNAWHEDDNGMTRDFLSMAGEEGASATDMVSVGELFSFPAMGMAPDLDFSC